MRKIICFVAIVVATLACSKKTSDEPKPANANSAVADVQLRLEASADASPATVSTSDSPSGGKFVTIGYNSFGTKPTVGYAANSLIPVVSFPVYSAQIASAGISEGCYNEYIELYSNAVALQTSSDKSAVCDFLNSLVKLSNECSQIDASSKAAIQTLVDFYATFGVCK